MRDTPSIRRFLTLRQFPGFADAELADLANIAENVIDASFAPGTVVAPPGRLAAMHLVVTGRLRAGEKVWGPNQLFGVFEVMAGRRTPHGAVATAPTETLRLAAVDFVEVLEDSYTILTSARRMLARRLFALEAKRSPSSPLAPRLDIEISTQPLGLVDRLILLRQHMAFGAGRAQALAALAQASDDVHFSAGGVIASRGDAAMRGLVILRGAVQATNRQGQSIVLGPGEGIGGLEMLGEIPFVRTYRALTPVRALACPAMALFDVMEDHTDFALGMVSRLAGAVLDLDGGFPTLVDSTRESATRVVS